MPYYYPFDTMSIMAQSLSLTVLILASDKQDGLSRTLQSISRQTAQPDKLFIEKNDGLNDTDSASLATLSNPYQLIDAGSAAECCRMAVDQLVTDYCCIIEAGDELSPSYFQNCLATGSTNEGDVVFTDLHHIGEDVSTIRIDKCAPESLASGDKVPVAPLIPVDALQDVQFDDFLAGTTFFTWDILLQLALHRTSFVKADNAYTSEYIPVEEYEEKANVSRSAVIPKTRIYCYLLKKYTPEYPEFIHHFALTNELIASAQIQQELREQRTEIAQLKEKLQLAQEYSHEMDSRVASLMNSARYKFGTTVLAPASFLRSIKHKGLREAFKAHAQEKATGSNLEVPYSPEQQALAYARYVQDHYPAQRDLNRLQRTALQRHPLFSIIMPTYNTDIRFLREAIESVIAQAYPQWQLIIVDDASTNRQVITTAQEYANNDNRIIVVPLVENHGIAGATNVGIDHADGTFVCLFDHDDLLWPNALYEVAKAVNDNPLARFIYTDEDKVDDDSHHHFEPFFKPDWNPALLRGVNYITHFVTIHKSLLTQYGKEDSSFNGAQDWELFLRLTRELDATAIVHIPKVLYSWRAHATSTAQSMGAKEYALKAQERAVREDCNARGYADAIISRNRYGWLDVAYPMVGTPLISIVIPSKNQYQVVRRCIESIYERSSYRNFEIILVDTGSNDPNVLNWYKEISKLHANFHQVSFVEPKFSYSKSCNYGASLASGELLVQLNNDTEVISPNWLEVLAGYAQQPEIGAVGPMLLYPGNTLIQHAGVGVGIGSYNASAGNLFVRMSKNRDDYSVTQQVMLRETRDSTAVTAACVMMTTQKFHEVGGFAEEFRVTFNDVDLCLKLREKGYRNIYTPIVQLTHHESISVGVPEKNNRDITELLAADDLFKERWHKYVANDPNYNINLNKNSSNFTL